MAARSPPRSGKGHRLLLCVLILYELYELICVLRLGLTKWGAPRSGLESGLPLSRTSRPCKACTSPLIYTHILVRCVCFSPNSCHILGALKGRSYENSLKVTLTHFLMVKPTNRCSLSLSLIYIYIICSLSLSLLHIYYNTYNTGEGECIDFEARG